MKDKSIRVITRTVTLTPPKYTLMEQYQEAALFKYITENKVIDITSPVMRSFPWNAHKIVKDCIRIGTLSCTNDLVTMTDKGVSYYEKISSKALDLGHRMEVRIVTTKHSKLSLQSTTSIVPFRKIA